MSNRKLREIKEVNGFRINHPHSAANIFYAMFTLILLAVPAAYCFLNVVQITEVATDVVSGFNGIDLVKVAIEFIKYISGQPYTIENPIFVQLISTDFAGNLIAQAVPYLYIVGAGILALMALFSVILLIIFIVHIIRGYLKHSGTVKVFASLNFTLSLLFALTFLVLYFGFASSTKSTSGEFTMWVWYNFMITGGYLVLLIVISSIYSINFKDSIPESELEYHDDEPTVEQVSKVHEIVTTKYEQSSELPPNLTTIGGHAFAENTNLKVANIQPEVTKIGYGAFANCLNLEVVNLPATITEIGYNAFFNCCSLTTINFAGSKEEWKKIRRGSNWLSKAGTTVVHCIDGAISVNPYN